MASYYNRYSQFISNGQNLPLPGITLPIGSEDKYYIFRQGKDRLDKLSNLYYSNPYSGWIIMLANPEFGGLEFLIPDMTTIRIPFPFNDALSRYETEINNNIILYGK